VVLPAALFTVWEPVLLSLSLPFTALFFLLRLQIQLFLSPSVLACGLVRTVSFSQTRPVPSPFLPAWRNHSARYGPEPEFLNILKCDLAESAITGFNFYYIFNDKTLNYKHLDHFLRTVKFTEKNLFYHKQKL
jgi:hypothetical protein